MFVYLDFQTRCVLRKSKQAANLVEKIEGFVQIIFMKLIDEPINHITYSLIGDSNLVFKMLYKLMIFCLEGQIGANGVSACSGIKIMNIKFYTACPALCSWGANMSKKIVRASSVDFHTYLAWLMP